MASLLPSLLPEPVQKKLIGLTQVAKLAWDKLPYSDTLRDRLSARLEKLKLGEMDPPERSSLELPSLCSAQGAAEFGAVRARSSKSAESMFSIAAIFFNYSRS